MNQSRGILRITHSFEVTNATGTHCKTKNSVIHTEFQVTEEEAVCIVQSYRAKNPELRIIGKFIVEAYL